MFEEGILFENLSNCNSFKGANQPCVMILHAATIPPHIALVYKEIYFSQTVVRGFEQLALSTIQTLISRKKIPSLLIPIHGKFHEVNKTDVSSVFQSAGKLVMGGSCLNPVKEALQLFNQDIPMHGTLPAWLIELKKKEMFDVVQSQFIDKAPSFYIPYYGVEEVNQRIHQLSSHN